MANYNKSFNFKSGVQVDYDNFIVNANGLVGIGTSVVSGHLLSVYGDTKIVGMVTSNTLYTDTANVGFLTASQGLSVSGVVTATSFSGSATGLTDIYAIAVDGWYIDGGNSYISTTFNVGIGTTQPQGKLQIGTAITFNSNGNATYSGIITASSFNGSGADLTSLNSTQLTGTINNARLPSNINVSGIITASSGFVGNVTGIASTARDIVSTADIFVNSINSGFSTTGILTAFTSLYVGTSGTAFAALNSGRIGIGTALPSSDLQIRKASGSLLEVISDSGQSRISIGQSVGVGKSTATLRFGHDNKTLDIINNDTGNINMYLHAGLSGVGTGRFAWIYGQDNSELASLTYDGKFGIGKTNPNNTLHVVGTSTVTGNAYFGSNVYVDNDLTINGNLVTTTLVLPPILNNTNLNASAGVSTFYNLEVLNNSILSKIGIGTTSPRVDIDAQNSTLIIGNIGIGTTGLYTDEVSNSTPALQLFNGNFLISSGDFIIISEENEVSSIGFNTFSPRCVVDFSDVGTASTTAGYFVPPKISTTDRNKNSNLSGIGGTVEGAIIYNITTKKHQGYGSTDGGTTFRWIDFY